MIYIYHENLIDITVAKIATTIRIFAIVTTDTLTYILTFTYHQYRAINSMCSIGPVRLSWCSDIMCAPGDAASVRGSLALHKEWHDQLNQVRYIYIHIYIYIYHMLYVQCQGPPL